MTGPSYFRPEWIKPTTEHVKTDVCVYGANSAGVAAAVELVRLGKSVVVLQPGKFVGGLTTGGLGETDYGRKHVIGGISREFYVGCGKHYGKDEEFKFEPHVASAVYEQMLRAHGVVVRLCQYVDKVEKSAGRIVAITLLGGLRVEAKVFIDASYEGDLMARAGVAYHVGREDNSTYDETLNGIQVKLTHQFSHPVDPFVKSGDESSGLLPGIVNEDLGKKQGQGDARVQAYCFRMCMTDDPALRVAWEKPEGFDASHHELAARWFAGEKDVYNDQISENHAIVPRKFDVFPNLTPGGFHKTDTNNHGPVSSDFIGMNHEWPEASYEARETIFQAHVTYQKGYYWFIANDERIPSRYREAYRTWGLPSDEFTETGHWPHQLYVREARRMIGEYVITEHDCRGTRKTDDSIGMGSYGMDSHNCSRFVTTDVTTGRPRVMNDGDVQVHGFAPYAIPYRSIVPKRSECLNLLVPVCLSSSHIAYGSARMEPVFMVLGQSAAGAASMMIESNCASQDIDIQKLREQLINEGQVLEVKA